MPGALNPYRDWQSGQRVLATLTFEGRNKFRFDLIVNRLWWYRDQTLSRKSHQRSEHLKVAILQDAIFNYKSSAEFGKIGFHRFPPFLTKAVQELELAVAV